MLDIKQLKEGDVLSYTEYYTVKKILTDTVHLVNESDSTISAGKSLVSSSFTSASYINEVVKMNASDLANLFRGATNVAMTVCFRKKPDVKNITKNASEKVNQQLKESAVNEMLNNLSSSIKNTKIGELDKSLKEVVESFLSETQVAVEDNIAKAIKENIKGEERVMIGRHNGKLTAQGHVQFIDMKIEKDASKDYDVRTRMVDPRTIQYIILKEIKYQLK